MKVMGGTWLKWRECYWCTQDAGNRYEGGGRRGRENKVERSSSSISQEVREHTALGENTKSCQLCWLLSIFFPQNMAFHLFTPQARITVLQCKRRAEIKHKFHILDTTMLFRGVFPTLLWQHFILVKRKTVVSHRNRIWWNWKKCACCTRESPGGY